MVKDTLVLKVMQDDNDLSLEDVRGPWKINIDDLLSVKYVVIIHNNKVIREYDLGPKFTFDIVTKEVSNLQINEFSGQVCLNSHMLDYSPETIVSFESHEYLRSLVIKDLKN